MQHISTAFHELHIRGNVNNHETCCISWVFCKWSQTLVLFPSSQVQDQMKNLLSGVSWYLPEKQEGNLSRVTFWKILLFPAIVPLLVRMSFTGSKCCNKDRLQLALAHQWGITTPSNKTDVFGIERERQGNWKGQESYYKYTTCLVWSPTFWKWLWHGCLVKINHTSASTQPGFCDVPSREWRHSLLLFGSAVRGNPRKTSTSFGAVFKQTDSSSWTNATVTKTSKSFFNISQYV